MNYREDLKIKLEKVNLAISEINDCEFDKEKKRNIKLELLSNIE